MNLVSSSIAAIRITPMAVGVGEMTSMTTTTGTGTHPPAGPS